MPNSIVVAEGETTRTHDTFLLSNNHSINIRKGRTTQSNNKQTERNNSPIDTS